MAKAFYEGYTAGRGPSPAIWAGCPIMEMIEDPSVGYLYWNDYLGPEDVTTGDGYTITAVTSGSIVGTDQAGGALLVSSGGNASNDDGVNVQIVGEKWLPAAGKTLWFEARVQFSNVETDSDQFFVGLHITDTTILASALGVSADSMIGFFTDDGTVATNVEFVTCYAASSEIDTDTDTDFEDDTWYKLGFKVYTDMGQLKIDYYVNGALVNTITDTDDIPIEEMTLSYVAQVEQTSADATILVDWARIAQLA